MRTIPRSTSHVMAILGLGSLGLCAGCNPSSTEGLASKPPPSTASSTVTPSPPPSAMTTSGAASSAGEGAGATRPIAPPALSFGGEPAPGVDTTAYGWHSDASITPLAAVDRLVDRLPPPAGFARRQLEPDSFGAWLRALPLAKPGTPVLAFDGRVILGGDDPRLAAVATLDVGTADLQQCADAVMRLHAEWAWSRGARDMSYRSASGVALPFERWARGERVRLEGKALVWVPSAKPASDHPTLRRYLDAVFAWANTVSLERQATPVPFDELRPGDFLMLPGNPGHTVLVLDLAVHPDGRRSILLGQSYMPAQSFHVLRPKAGDAWFAVDPTTEGIQTPFWPAPFPWSSIRRLDT